MKIVILEADSLGQDMVFTPFEALGEVVIYRSTTADEMEEKTKDADVIVANKVPICESTIGKAQNLKLVCLTATGFNNLDGDYLKKRGIAAYNVAGYSTNGVAQHTFALLFYILEKLNYYDNYVKSGEYARGSCFSPKSGEYCFGGLTESVYGLANLIKGEALWLRRSDTYRKDLVENGYRDHCQRQEKGIDSRILHRLLRRAQPTQSVRDRD